MIWRCPNTGQTKLLAPASQGSEPGVPVCSCCQPPSPMVAVILTSRPEAS